MIQDGHEGRAQGAGTQAGQREVDPHAVNRLVLLMGFGFRSRQICSVICTLYGIPSVCTIAMVYSAKLVTLLASGFIMIIIIN